MKDLNKIQEFFSKPLNEGRIDQSQIFDQSEVDRIIGEVREITDILEDTYNKDVQYKEFRFGDGTGGFQFQWDHGGRRWGGRFGLSLKEDGAHKLSALSYYDNSSFGSEDIKPNNPIILDVETWKDLDTSMLVSIWSQLKPMVIKNEAAARESLSREAKAQSDYYKGKADTGRIGYGLSSQPRMRNESEIGVKTPPYKLETGNVYLLPSGQILTMTSGVDQGERLTYTIFTPKTGETAEEWNYYKKMVRNPGKWKILHEPSNESVNEAHINEGSFNPQQFELLRRKISGRYGKRFDITKSRQFITIDVGDFNINIVSDASHDMVFVEMDSDNLRKSKEYGMRDYNKIFKVIDTWLKNHVNESVNEAEFKHISGRENKIKLAIKDVEKQARLKANRDKPLEYAQLSLNKIMLSKVLGREELGKEHQGAWEKLKKEYNLNESVNEGKEWSPSEQKMANQITRYKKEGLNIFRLPVKTQEFYRKHQDKFEESVNEMDMNDPIMMKMRAAKDKKPDFGKAYGDAVKTAYGNDKNAKKLAFLKKERAQLMRDMEQEAEPEGGPIADEYGSKLNRIDAAIAKLSGRKEMTYDQAIAEAKVDYDFSERELIRVLRQLKRGASTEIDMIKAFTKTLGRDITKDELFSEAIAEGESKMPTQDQVDKFFALTQNEMHYLNSKPVAGQEKTFNKMEVEPWDEYDLSNWNALVGKAKKSKEYQLKIARAAFEKAEQDGDIRKQELALAAIDLINNNISETVNEATSKYPNFDLDKNIRYQSTSISKGMWRYTGKEQGGKGVYRNLNNNQFLGFSSDDFKYFKKHLSSHFDIIESLDETIVESVNEAKLSTIHNAAKQGNYPVTMVVTSNGKVIKQELVGTPEIAPAAFNQLQKEYPNATISIEDRTGKILFTEPVNEEKPGLWSNIRAKKKRGEKPAHGNSKSHKTAVKAGKKIRIIK